MIKTQMRRYEKNKSKSIFALENFGILDFRLSDSSRTRLLLFLLVTLYTHSCSCTIAVKKENFVQLPPLTPPYTGGGEVSLRLREITKRFLPLCKAELLSPSLFVILSSRRISRHNARYWQEMLRYRSA